VYEYFTHCLSLAALTINSFILLSQIFLVRLTDQQA